MRRYLAALAVAAALIFTTSCELSIPVIHQASRSPGPLTQPFSPVVPQVPDPPARVIRISYLQDGVSFRAAGIDTWARAELNRPVVEGDALWADVAARAELDAGSAAIRMDARTSLDVLSFDDHTLQVRFPRGVMEATVRDMASGEVLEIDTPNVAIRLLCAGEYRVEVDRDMDATFITVRSGDVDISGMRINFAAHTGERVNVTGTDVDAYGLAAVPAKDRFDQFCESRDSVGLSDWDRSGTGARMPVGVESGRREVCPPDGRRIASDIGPGLSLGAGPGSTKPRGASLRPTMADGCF